MKILQVNSAKNWGGGEVYTINLCQKLIDKGYEVALACRPGSAINQTALKNGITVLELPLTGAADFRSAWKLSRYCRKNEIDIVHVHLARDYWIARYLKT
ncbi:MAG: glycosyltransferase, partial [Firmicutes bacterium]|nr:glycosyltransferase [Bacillota bacterium]